MFQYLLMVMQTIFYSPAGIYMFKVNNKNTRTRFKIRSKFTPCSGTSIVNFEHVIADWISTLTYLQIASTYNIFTFTQNRSLFVGFGFTDKPLDHLIGVISRRKIKRCYSQLSISKIRILLTKTKLTIANLHG